MSVGYILINQTKRQKVCFLHLPVNSKREIAGNPVGAAIVAWYLLENAGDRIAFVSDSAGEWPFDDGSRVESSHYPDMTDQVVDALIAARIVDDKGHAWFDEHKPDTVFIRDLRNIWMD